METAAAVVVGGGIIGASIAYHLAADGVKDVVLLEREQLFGADSTGKCAGGIRAQFTTPVNIALSMASVPRFVAFKEEMGVEAVFNQVGYMFMASTEDNWARTQKNVALQQSHGLEVTLLSPEEVRERVSHLRVDDLLGATWCPTDGIADPNDFLLGYLKRARDLGVRVVTERGAIGLDRDGDRVVGLQTTRGPIATPVVINATGAWAAQVGRMVGLDLPIQPIRRHITTTGALDWISTREPMMVDNGTGLYMHPEGQGLLMGMARHDEPPAFRTDVDEEFVMNIVEAAIYRMPRLEDATIASSWAGLYEVTPDHHPIIEAHAEVPGLFTCAGFSGHGFMHAPAAGDLISRLVRGEEPGLDLTPLRSARFREASLVHEAMVI
ncbi:MAG: FAD-dependent oxidoreductase [Candidatus Sericytochromatia bacterium]|nr:FAD-dependent oxidoreductase [Candidatus Sericytochromatia bacterium]